MEQALQPTVECRFDLDGAENNHVTATYQLAHARALQSSTWGHCTICDRRMQACSSGCQHLIAVGKLSSRGMKCLLLSSCWRAGRPRHLAQARCTLNGAAVEGASHCCAKTCLKTKQIRNCAGASAQCLCQPKASLHCCNACHRCNASPVDEHCGAACQAAHLIADYAGAAAAVSLEVPDCRLKPPCQFLP